MTVEIDYDFLKKYSEYMELYKESMLPVMICDSKLNVGLRNSAAETLYPYLTDKKGFDLLLGEFDKKKLLKRMKSEGTIWIENLIGLGNIMLTLTPIIKGGKIYGVVAELMNKNAVISLSDARLSSQTPARIEAGIRGSVAEIFRAMDVATHMEHLFLEKAELKKLGLDAGFISSCFDSIAQHSYHLLRTIKNISVYSQYIVEPSSVTLETVDMFELISKAAVAIKPLAADMGIPVEFSLPEGDSVVALDVEKFELAFFNILNNAFYFTREGNAVTITGKLRQKTISVTVSDLGAGISKEALPHIFKAYFSLGHGSKSAGTGLGLTVAELMIKALKGEISVKSTQNSGTEVTITIPRGNFTSSPATLQSGTKSSASDRFSFLYVGLADAANSPYNAKKKTNHIFSHIPPM